MTRCLYCGARIEDNSCHCGGDGRRMREPDSADIVDAVAAYEKANPDFFAMIEEENKEHAP